LTRTLRNLQAAREEFAEAVRWYDEQRAGLGAEFFDEVAATTARLEVHPEIGAPVSLDRLTRRLLVPRFPYQVVYRFTPNEIVILAVAHLKRRPNYWKNRK
jgi:plasmid stabilization system protein ParE